MFSFPPVLELLARIPLLQSLVVCGLADVSVPDTGSQPKTLLEWISAQVCDQVERNWIRRLKTDLETRFQSLIFLGFLFFLSVYWCGFVYSLMFQYSVWVSLRFGIKLSFLRCESISRDFSERKHTDNIQTTNIQTYWTTCHNRILFACCNIMLTLYCFESVVWKIGFSYCIVCKYVLLYRMRTIHWNRWCSNARQDWNRLE